MVYIGGSGLPRKASKNKCTLQAPTSSSMAYHQQKVDSPVIGISEKERRAALQNRAPFNAHPLSSFKYTSMGPPQNKLTTTSYDFIRKLKIKPDVYHLPAAPSKIGFNSLILLSSILYLFQFTVARTYCDIKDFVSFFDRCTGHLV